MEAIWQNPHVIRHTATLVRSHLQFTKRDLLPGLFNPLGLSKNIFEAPFVVVSHGTEGDPVLNYGNAAALRLWEMSWSELTQTPSRLTAEAPLQADRARLLATVAEQGFIENYAGIRVSRSGRRFHIPRATVWNLVTESGEPCGQAATFSEWTYL